MDRAPRHSAASISVSKSAKKRNLRLEIAHTAVVPRDPVVTFRVLTDGRGELTSLDLVGAPAKVAHIDKVADRGATFTENAARVTLSNGISFDYREISRSPGKFFAAQMSNFTGRGTLYLTRVVSEWTLTPRAVPGNAIGSTVVEWRIKFYPRSSVARWIMRIWLSVHWRHVSARGMRENLQRVAEFDEPSVGGHIAGG